jgi:SAM-dependent methyltransferase
MSKPNEKMAAYWNEQAGPRWVQHQEQLDATIADIGLAAIEAGAPERGESVLDVGCGCGTTTLELARRVGEQGRVQGLDVSGPMLERARQRITEAGYEQVRLELGDAQVTPFAGDFDLVFSRFGVMFFEDPSAAFANLRSAVRPGGRLAFVCWRARELNPWMWTAMMAAAQHVELPAAPDDPHAPGPFGLHDAERLSRILAEAGWTDASLEDVQVTMRIGGGVPVDEAVAFAMESGPLPDLLRDANEATRERVAASVREVLLPHEGPEGVAMSGAARIVSARRPD